MSPSCDLERHAKPQRRQCSGVDALGADLGDHAAGPRLHHRGVQSVGPRHQVWLGHHRVADSDRAGGSELAASVAYARAIASQRQRDRGRGAAVDAPDQLVRRQRRPTARWSPPLAAAPDANAPRSPTCPIRAAGRAPAAPRACPNSCSRAASASTSSWTIASASAGQSDGWPPHARSASVAPIAASQRATTSRCTDSALCDPQASASIAVSRPKRSTPPSTTSGKS